MKTILIADDDPNLRLLVNLSLDHPEFAVMEATTGLEAVSILERETVDLVILDWMMPIMSGLEVARFIRSQSGFATIPIVMLTAKTHDSDVCVAQCAGVSSYLMKPFSPNELLETVEKALQSVQA